MFAGSRIINPQQITFLIQHQTTAGNHQSKKAIQLITFESEHGFAGDYLLSLKHP